jgi:hypothetical protein
MSFCWLDLSSLANRTLNSLLRFAVGKRQADPVALNRLTIKAASPIDNSKMTGHQRVRGRLGSVVLKWKTLIPSQYIDVSILIYLRPDDIIFVHIHGVKDVVSSIRNRLGAMQ